MEGLIKRFDLIFCPFVGALLILLLLLIFRFWRVGQSAPEMPKPSRRKREPKPFAGYICKYEAGLRQQLTLLQMYHNFILLQAYMY
ncbi:MAG: hypothetical protein ETSY1_09805 [Candidatus Entotheonella factor]|uniref:Uncharacterized protein n=1 Tax=Entotheonella factor TaxID=1429438 RepID=W4LTT0_ENTF1|nr:MAG: hypothetical protein ETSY1_09805 [Candidatus Entotheonella factor]